MLRLYENAFSPFARKIRMALEHKQLDFEDVDGLSRAHRDELAAVNGRIEVPALVDDEVVVVNSADIALYLDRRFPERPLYPEAPAEFARARAWERCSDTVIDAILVDISYWVWAERDDERPPELLAAAQTDMEEVWAALEQELAGRDFVVGELGIVDFALFPHVTGTRLLGVPFDADRHPNVHAWQKRLRSMAPFAEDLARTKAYLSDPTTLDVERRKIFWRGDRLEWMLARGQHRWLMREIEEDRVLWPGLALPAPRAAG